MLFLLLIPIGLQAKESITWAVTNSPPVHILEGPYQYQGMSDFFLKIFEREGLKEYRHEIEKMSIARMWSEIKNGKNLCSVSSLKTEERGNLAYFTKWQAIVPTVSIIVKSTRRQKLFSDNKFISLKKLLTQNKLKLGIVNSRTYSPAIDKMLENYKTSKNIVKINGSETSGRLHKMMMLDRIDYIIEYPWSAKYTALIAQQGEIASIPIEENPLRYSKAQIACTKNKWGKTIIEKLDVYLAKVVPTIRLRNSIERWLDNKSIPMFREEYEKVFGLSAEKIL